jgi:hypothetical protein
MSAAMATKQERNTSGEYEDSARAVNALWR